MKSLLKFQKIYFN